jgi:hypothetical protein
MIVRLKYAHRLARLHQQSFIILEVFQRRNDSVICLPTARRASRSAIHDKVLGALGNVRVEIVHEHAHGSFLLPAFAVDLIAARGTNGRWGLSEFGSNRHE